MANRIDTTFSSLHRRRRKALIGYITAGHPRRSSLQTLVPMLEKAGLDLLEIGIPFSDPIADGPTIQHSSQKALENGTTLRGVLRTVRTLRKHVSLPIVFMSYSNPIYSMGLSAFFKSARNSGVDGLIIPDMIPEEAGDFLKAAKPFGIHLIFLVSPTTPESRIRQIGRATRGFLYAVSLTGVTGTRQGLPSNLQTFLRRVRASTRHPVAVGFGISTPAQARAASSVVDGVIVGSALIKEIERSQHHRFKSAAQFIQSLRRAIDRKE